MADHRNGKASAAGSAYAIDLNTFQTRLKTLYKHWDESRTDLWGSSDAIAVACPPPSKNTRYLKSTALFLWLLGFEFPETIMVFTKVQTHILCSQKKASILESVKKPAKESVGVEIVLHVKPKIDDGASLMDAIIRAIRTQSKSSGHDSSTVGHIAREEPEGKLLDLWAEKLKSSKFNLSDVANGFSALFAAKSNEEITSIKRAAYLTTNVMKNFVVSKLENVIDEEKKILNSTLMKETEKVILEPSKVNCKLKADNVDICYSPIFQSGGKFDLRPITGSNDEALYYETASVIICALGARYKSYCSNIARTFVIDAEPIQSKAYEVLLKAHEAVIGSLKPGNKLAAAYLAAVSVVEKEAPEMVSCLTKSAGAGIGIEFRESGLNINAKNDQIVKEGMAFNVSLGFQNLQCENSKSKNKVFALLLADTVIINKDKTDVVTSLSSKALKDVAYSFNEDGEEEKPKSMVDHSGTEHLVSKTTLRSDNHEISKEELRRQHQAELARQKNEETARRLAGGGNGTGVNRFSSRSSAELVAYKNIYDLPSPREMMIQIDQKNEAVLLPINGSMVPFHVAFIRTVSSQQDTNHNCYVRIIFNVPGTPSSSHDPNLLKFQGSIYLKEASFRSKDSRHISEVVRSIKTFRQQVVARESERAERATLVTQEKLQLANNIFKPIRLHDLWIRPALGGRGRKIPGTLETHVNGFRYSTTRSDERVDVMFANIKHAFFQPAENEMITLLHFHLHNHIMVGNKKTKDVQFYVEVMDMVQNVGGGKRSAYDPDELEEEQRERERKNKINVEFQSFVNRVNDLWGQPQFNGLDLEFDQPLRELGFPGVPHKSSVFIVPTSACIVELIETPFLVVTLSEIEIVNLERVGLGQKNFDMTIVFKDFKRNFFRIDSIPSTSIDGIKEWLDTTDIKYYESRLNLNWRQILKTITDDPQSFIEGGGWEFLNLEAADSESEGSEESDKGYEPSDIEPESDSEEEDSESASLVESEEEEDSEEDSEEEQGKTWEELERDASNADREKGNESDSEEDRKRRKAKAAFGKPRGNLSSSMPKRPKLR
ncbi:putative peptidase M24, FACT complex subunit Spt16p/Cdc68p, creatinase/Aminopeptidase P/Spt16 [Medicago truncatula]|uniref:FACT complex subunit n=1 Tax=Medicago truncatula TaxID=3880 RepID=G7KK14_MEDTR|nr:FACT complex subunit SPT16 [Medicago truncatula]AES74653.1 global transcription factor [Medicago truncatula]RHN49965.1 putative peptidase M24, FACT complex subunit Spt16p/Cdc68p, creatinase/Aminopeptidase P/Spt16 [Medicago truncatula]